MSGRYCGYVDGPTANDQTTCRSSVIHGRMAAPTAIECDQKARVVESHAHLTVCALRQAAATLVRALRQSSARAWR